MFFASESNSYPLFYHQSPSCTNALLDNNNNTLFHHHHHHHHHGRYNNNYLLQPTYPSSSENPIVKLSSQPSINQENTINYPSNMIDPMPDTRRSTGKKDRHTKICTAQGIRDRRVRLSMSVARKFFNLQDMLGFEKASETLGWLLAKSEAAIDELTNTSNNNTIAPIEDLDEEDDEYVDDEKSGLDESSLRKKRKRRELNSLKEQNMVEEVRREKARQRARERTRKKKTIVYDCNDHQQQQQQQHQLERFDHHQQIHQRVQQDLMICQSSSSATPNSIPNISQGANVGETVVINKDNKSRSSVDNTYEMMSSKDDQEGGNHCNDFFNRFASENCNYSGIMQQPAGLFPALNIINLSTEIHINARPWDTYSNQILH